MPTATASRTTQDAFALDMAIEVTNEHAASGCCTPTSPCQIVQVHQATRARIEAGSSVAVPVAVDHSGHRPAGGHVGANQHGAYKVRVPSDKQVAFVKRLLATRVLPNPIDNPHTVRALDAFRAGTANLRQVSDLIDWLLGLDEREVPAGQVRTPASDKQVGFIRRLAAERAWENSQVSDTVQTILNDGQVEKVSASRAITELTTNTPRRPREQRVELEAGIYLVDGVVAKVQKAVHGSGNMYAKVLNVETRKFEYATGLVSKIRPNQRMSLAQAKEFGAVYGVCCVCSRTLTDETSIEAGIGPVCAGRLG